MTRPELEQADYYLAEAYALLEDAMILVDGSRSIQRSEYTEAEDDIEAALHAAFFCLKSAAKILGITIDEVLPLPEDIYKIQIDKGFDLADSLDKIIEDLYADIINE